MSPHRARPITVQSSWLCKSLTERIEILRTVAPERADAVSILVDEALKDEWDRMGPPYGTGPKRDGGVK